MFKYQNEGGLSPEDIVAFFGTHSSQPNEDIGTFVDALAFSWLIAGTDAHAKNYSILHGGRGRVHLAPLYDVASTLPSDNLDPERIKLAMKIGGEYRVRDIGPRQWRKLASDLRLDPDETIERVRGLASRVPEGAATIRDRFKNEGLRHKIIDRLGDALASRAENCCRTRES